MDEQRVREIVKEEIAAIRQEEQRQARKAIQENGDFNGDVEITTMGCCSNP